MFVVCIVKEDAKANTHTQKSLFVIVVNTKYEIYK